MYYHLKPGSHVMRQKLRDTCDSTVWVFTRKAAAKARITGPDDKTVLSRAFEIPPHSEIGFCMCHLQFFWTFCWTQWQTHLHHSNKQMNSEFQLFAANAKVEGQFECTKKFDFHKILLLKLVANLAKHIQRIIVQGSHSVKCYIHIACWSQSLKCNEPLSKNIQLQLNLVC